MKIGISGIPRARLFSAATLILPMILAQGFGSVSYTIPLTVVIGSYCLLLAWTLLCYPNPIGLSPRLFVLVWLVIAITVFHAFLSTVVGPDAHKYYRFASENSFGELFAALVEQLHFLGAKFTFFNWAFSGIMRAYLGDLITRTPMFVVLVNFLFLILSAFSWCDALRISFGSSVFARKRIYTIFFIVYLCTASTIYWANVFNKDILVLATSVFCASSFCKKRYVVAALWLILASLIRPYSIAIIASYLVFLQLDLKRALVALIGVLSVALLASNFSVDMAINIPIYAVYFFASPNPADPSNWLFDPSKALSTVQVPGFLAIEGTLFAAALLAGLFYCWSNPATRRIFIKLGIALVISATIMGLLAYMRTYNHSLYYGIMALGADILRKKLSFFPLIVTWVSLCVTLAQERFRKRTPTRTVLMNRLLNDK